MGWVVALSIAMAGLSVAGFALVWQQYKEARESLRWPTTTGRITRVELKRFERWSGLWEALPGVNPCLFLPNREGESARGITQPALCDKGLIVRFLPHITYTYRVDGRVYTSVRVSTGPLPMLKEEEAQRFLQRYPAGAEVKVHYCPGDPSRAVLEPGKTGTFIFAVLVLLVMLLFAAGFALWVFFVRGYY